MRSYEEAVRELVRVLERIAARNRAVGFLNAKMQVDRWTAGRICFEIFPHGRKTPTGLTVSQFAKEVGRAPGNIYRPLGVYRVLGNWYERQIEAVKFTIAELTVKHTQDVADAERLMELWRKQGEPDEAEWKSFLSGGKTTGPRERHPNLSHSNDKAAVLAAFNNFERYVDAALDSRFFANRFIPAERAASVAKKINTLNGKRRNLLKTAKPNKKPERELPAEPAAAPAGELLAPCAA